MNIKPIVLAVSLLLCISAFAQHNEEVTIEGTYRPKVNKVDKIVLRPEIPEQKFEMPAAKTHLMEVDRRFPLEFEKLDAQYYNGKNARMPESTKNFLLVGMGSRISPVFLYKHNSKLTKNLGLGVGIKHHSSWLDIKDYAPSSFMNNAFEIGLTSSKYKGVQLGGNVYYKNDLYHYYGVNLKDHPLTPVEMGNYCGGVTYHTLGAHFGLVSTSTRVGEFSHKASADYRFFMGCVQTTDFIGCEHTAELDYGLSYTENWWGDRNYPQKLGLDMGMEYAYDVLNSLESRMDVTFNPFFEMKGDFYRLRFGMKADWMNADPKFTVAPDLNGSLFVLNHKLEFYAGLNGGWRLLTLQELVTENPFLAMGKMGLFLPTQMGQLFPTHVKLGFDGGLRTNIAEVVDLHLGVRYRHTDNDPLYVCDFLDTYPSDPIYNTFSLVYDETQRVSVLADMRLKLRSGFTADLGFAYNHYDLSKYQYAWHRPTTEGSAKLTYEFNEKLSLSTSFLYQGGRYAAFVPAFGVPPQVTGTKKLKDVFDLGLGADYRVNDQLSVFAKLDNVANQKYQLYYDYPVTGIQFFAGLKMRF